MMKVPSPRVIVVYALLIMLSVLAGSPKAAHRTPVETASPVAATVAGTTEAAKSAEGAEEAAEAEVNLGDYGAVGDGAADDGPALQRALDALAALGGGTLRVPAGRFAIRTPVAADFTSRARTLRLRGVPSDVIVDTSFTADVLTRGLSLPSEFYPMTGEAEIALRLSGLDTLEVRDLAFVGTPDFPTDALITLDFDRIGQATIHHCEFYGLRTDAPGGAIVSAARSRLRVEQSMFLGSFGYSALYVPVIQNLEWEDIYVTTTIFADYGQRPGFHGKTEGATFSWVTVGDPAAPTPLAPRREVVIRDVIFDEGAMFGLFSQPERYRAPSPAVDLIYISDLFQNVSNLGTAGTLIYDARRVLIERTHYGYSRYTSGAIDLRHAGAGIIDRTECVDAADLIHADAATGQLSVINSVYRDVISQAGVTRLRQDVADADDPVWYVRHEYERALGREPEPAEHFYWSQRLLECDDSESGGAGVAECVTATRAALGTYLAARPAPTFTLTGKVSGEGGAGLAGVTVTLFDGDGRPLVATRTDERGEYRFAALPTGGEYTVTAATDYYLMEPAAHTLVAPVGDRREDFAAGARTFAVRGRVVTTNNYGFGGVRVTLSGGATAEAVTDAEGYFSFTGLVGLRSYTVTPRLAHHTFVPAAQTIGSLTSDQTLSFSGALNRYAVSGRVSDGRGQAIAGAAVTLSGAQAGATTTDGAGRYAFTGLPATSSYTVTVGMAAAGYTFTPAQRTYPSLTGDETGGDFTALYSIRGRVSEAGAGTASSGLTGVTVRLSGAQAATAVTDASGNYAFMNLGAGGNYTVTAEATHYSFSPGAAQYTALAAPQVGDFTATRNRHTISGRVTEGANTALGGVTVTLTSAQGATTTTTTDAAGNYSFANLPAGNNYTVAAARTHYTFAPVTHTVNNLSGNATANFAGTLKRYAIGGRVTTGADNLPLPGVTVTLSGAQGATTTTDASGNYAFANLAAGGAYVVTAAKTGYAFTPASRAVNVLEADRTEHFTGTLERYEVAGRVVNINNYGLAGITVRLTGGRSAETVTDKDGYFSFPGLEALRSYTVTPTVRFHTTEPVARTFASLTGRQVVNFIARLNSHTIGGRVTDGGNNAMSGVSVTLTDAQQQQQRTTTDAAGNYSFANLPAGSDYTVTASRTHYTFNPANPVFSSLDANQTANFTGALNKHNLSGRITDGANNALPGVTITLSGTQSKVATTDTNGHYLIAGLDGGGNYTVTPTLTHYTFAPPSQSLSNLSGDRAANFAATLNTHTLGGRISNAAGNANLSGVTVTLSGSQSATTTTDTQGNYSFPGLPAGGNYSITPAHAHYTFSPASLAFANLDGNRAGANFSGTLNRYAIGGRATDAAGAGLAGVSVELRGDQSATTTTDAGGNYSFPGLPAGGNYNVTPALANYTFNPPSLSFNNLSVNQAANFSATRNVHNINGQIKDANNVALGGVNVTLSGGQAATATTDATGNYSFSNLPAGASYVVTPAKQNYTFAPVGASFSNLSANGTANFIASLNAHAIGGRITDGSGKPLANVTLSLAGARTSSAVSDVNGNYTFTNLPAGNTYTVTPALANYTFAPSSRTFDGLSADEKADFGGTLNLHKISGRISAGTDGLTGVLITLSGPQSGTVLTDANGVYTFAGLPAGGNYVVTPSRTNYSFNPGSLPFNNLSADQAANFAATLNTYTISGHISNAAGNANLSGVTVTLSGSQSATTTTDAQGNYSFPGLPAGGNYDVTPRFANYTFSPGGSLSFINLNGNRAGANFSGTLNRHSIGGRATDAAGAGLAGMSLELRGDQSATTTTDASGNYSFPGLPAGGNYTITPAHAHYTFSPASLAFANLDGNRAGANFSGTLNRYAIGGRATDAAGAGLAGVSLELRGDQSATTTTDASGNYSFPGLPAGGNYNVTASKQNFTFTPPLKAFASLGGDQTGADFRGEAVLKIVQFGQLSYQASEGSARVTLVVTRTGDVSEAATVAYLFEEGAAGIPCAIANGAADARCDYHGAAGIVAFAPGEATREITIQLIDDTHVEGAETLRLRLSSATGATLGAQSTATLVIQDNDTAAAQNPIFTTPFFIRMQYLDFLSREPEAGEPWSAILDGCSSVNNPACDRVHVSQSFFGSPEFRLKGFYAFNFYRVAFGRRPTYEEIMPDMRSITGATTEETYRKRAAFPVAFTQSAEFKERYDSLADVAFVNALLDRYGAQQITTHDPANPEGGAKVVLTRAELAGRLGAKGGAGSLTRAQVLRAVVESDEVAAAEYNGAFVAMQYYGYLRRSPEEEGYQAWLKVIARNPENIRLMVDGFMNSTEYQLRFGAPKAAGGVNEVTGR